MGTAYTLSLFDPADTPCKGVDTRQLHSVEQVVSLLQMLDRARPGANPRFERLMNLLDCAHPGHGVGFSGRADGLPMRPEPGSKQRFGPGADQAVLLLAVDLDQCDLVAVMPDLLFWSRELGLDVFDELQGIFLPWRALPVPKETGLAFARQSGWAAPLKVWNNALELRQVLIDRLTHLLVDHGYGFRVEPGYDAVFERETDDGFQRIAARIGGAPPALTCKFDIEQGSRRFTQVMQSAGYPLGNPEGTRLILNEQLVSFRTLNHPGWDRLSGHVVHLVWTQGWLDWMLDDLGALVLPVLEQARTAEGLCKLYTDPQSAGRFPRAVREHGDVSRFAMLPAIAAAYFAGSPQFELLTLRCLKQLKLGEQPGQRDGQSEQITRLVDALRSSATPETGMSA